MALRDRAVLVVETTDDNDETRTGEFHLIAAESDSSLNREMLIGNRGQIISGLADVAPLVPDLFGNAEGVNIDAGQGQDELVLQFENGQERDAEADPAPQWGDGSGGTSRWDATGAHPQTKEQVLQWWLRTSSTDSRSPARLHWGEWTDGAINGEEGLFGEPIDCIVLSVDTDWEHDEPSAFTGRVELLRTGSFPEVEGGFDFDDILGDR